MLNILQSIENHVPRCLGACVRAGALSIQFSQGSGNGLPCDTVNIWAALGAEASGILDRNLCGMQVHYLRQYV